VLEGAIPEGELVPLLTTIPPELGQETEEPPPGAGPIFCPNAAVLRSSAASASQNFFMLVKPY
jgi:hypothetical protein